MTYTKSRVLGGGGLSVGVAVLSVGVGSYVFGLGFVSFYMFLPQRH